MATAEFGETPGMDDMASPSWAWPAIRVTEEESEAWLELEARLRLTGSQEEGK